MRPPAALAVTGSKRQHPAAIKKPSKTAKKSHRIVNFITRLIHQG
jgi:hypothetical protein